jgi:hypothetical protein
MNFLIDVPLALGAIVFLEAWIYIGGWGQDEE